MKKTILILGAALLPMLAGCSLFGDEIAEEVADGVDRYCGEPLDARELYRSRINAQLAAEPGGGVSITVVCEGDPTGYRYEISTDDATGEEPERLAREGTSQYRERTRSPDGGLAHLAAAGSRAGEDHRRHDRFRGRYELEPDG